jgi:predicted RNase H-like HicB family nuclease
LLARSSAKAGRRVSRQVGLSALQRLPETETVFQKPRHERDYNKVGSSMQRQFDVIIERDSEGYYIASVPQLRGCHTQAHSLDTVVERIREAIALCLEVEGGASTDLEFVGIQRVTVAA